MGEAMKYTLRWQAFDELCRELAAANEGSAFWIENPTGEVMAGSRPEPDSGRCCRELEDDGQVGRLLACATGSDATSGARLLQALVSREIKQQSTVRDMADATARLWRQTNAFLRMAETTHLSFDPAVALDKVLDVIEHSTSFRRGWGMLKFPGSEGWRLLGDFDGNPAEGSHAPGIEVQPPATEAFDEDVKLLQPGCEDSELYEQLSSTLGRSGPLAVASLGTGQGCYGYLLVPADDPDLLTSEDFKVLAAAAQILGVAVENAHILGREREDMRLQVENDMLALQARDMEEMTHVVAHDLRSPMHSIYGFMHVALDELSDLSARLSQDGYNNATGMETMVADPIRDAIRSVEKLNRMVKRLLEFSRSARAPYNCEYLDMNDLVDGVVRSFGYALAQDEVTVTVEALPPLVADRVQMEAVLGNLVDNAAKYIGDGPERSVVVGCVEGDHGREYFVRDTGVGMTPEQAAKVFQPFRRFHADSVPGEGIGLAHVRKIIERHGGKIRCETTEGVGTTFYFSVGSESGAVADEVPEALQAAE